MQMTIMINMKSAIDHQPPVVEVVVAPTVIMIDQQQPVVVVVAPTVILNPKEKENQPKKITRTVKMVLYSKDIEMNDQSVSN